jgi:uridine phosphorylase
MVSATIHLQPTAPLAERVLVPGDPGRALLLAQALLREPKMFNHNRGLWGYTGEAADGELLTIQSTGMGGPSAAIVISELAELGAGRIIRVGTCVAFDQALALGDLIAATSAIAADGTSRALGAGERVQGDGDLTAALCADERARPAVVVSTDLFYDSRETLEDEWIAAGAAVVEMETATLFALGAARSIRTASVLIVSDLVRPARARIGTEELREAELRLGEAALSALSAARQQTQPT